MFDGKWRMLACGSYVDLTQCEDPFAARRAHRAVIVILVFVPRLISCSRLVVVAVAMWMEIRAGAKKALHSPSNGRVVENALDVRDHREQIVAGIAHAVDR